MARTPPRPLRTSVLAVALIAALASGAARAQNRPSGLNDLIDQNENFVGREMPKRGYALTHSESVNNTVYQYWWNREDRVCVRLDLGDGQVKDLSRADARDCTSASRPRRSAIRPGERAAPPQRDPAEYERGFRDGLYQRGFRNHENRPEYAEGYQLGQQRRIDPNPGRPAEGSQAQRDPAEYERGFRDGLYQRGFHNYQNRPEYAEGYQLGQQRRANPGQGVAPPVPPGQRDPAEYQRGFDDGLYQRGFRNYENRPEYAEGYQLGQERRATQNPYRTPQGDRGAAAPAGNLQDLIGARGRALDNDLPKRGFRNIGGFQQGGEAFTNWWNPRTRQCMQAVVREGRVHRIYPVDAANCA